MKAFKRLFVTVFGLFAATAAMAEAKQAPLSFAGYEGETALVDFQVLVKLSEGQYGFSYNDYAAKDGSDLWFADSSGNVIPHEIDSWDASGNSFVWVRAPEVTGSKSYIVMHWGEERTAEQKTTANVWKNNGDGRGGFVGVWHMGVATGSEPEPDAAGNGLDAVPYTESDSLAKMTATVNTSFFSGHVRQNADSNGEKNGLKVPDYSGVITDESRFTVSGWFRCSNAFNSIYKRLFSSTGLDGSTISNGWEVRQNGDFRRGAENQHRTLAVSAYDGITSVDCVQHDLTLTYLYKAVYITVVFDGTLAYIYENGVSQGSPDTIPACKARQSYLSEEELTNVVNNFGFLIGHRMGTGNGWIGFYDEVRMYDGVESPDRVKANYDTMTRPTEFLMKATSTTVAKAFWYGDGHDGDISNPANWHCFNVYGEAMTGVIPTKDTTVAIAGESLYLDVTREKPLAYNVLSIGNCTLAHDCDWRGLGADVMAHAAGSTINLNGHNLAVAGLASTTVSTIENSSRGDPAVLCVDVAGGAVDNNVNILIDGNIRFVKEGEGTVVTSRESGQSYTGGTYINAGTMQPKDPYNYDGTQTGAYYSSEPFGTGEIVVNPGAFFELRSNYGYSRRDLRLNGGTLINSGRIPPKVGWPSDMVSEGYSGSSVRRLMADSYMVVNSSIVYGNQELYPDTDLGGHTLACTIAEDKTLLLQCPLKNGTFTASGAGTVKVKTVNPELEFDMKTTTLETDCALDIAAPVDVRDYVANYAGTANAGTEVLCVYGVFKPVETGFYGPTMQNGSMLDLREWKGEWPMRSSGAEESRRDIEISGYATVEVDVAGRDDLGELADEGTYLLKWEEGATCEPGAQFKFAAGSRKLPFVLVHDYMGIRLIRKRMVIFLR